MTVAVALIAKNEELTIPRVIASLQGAVDEIIVADTGSTDRTKAVAASAGAKVVDFPWIDDFAAARQFAFEQATTDWVCWVDADDVVIRADHIRRETDAAEPGVNAIYWRYVLGRDASGKPTFDYWRERCVRNNSSHKWVGRVHEVLVQVEPGATIRSESVLVEHHPDPQRDSHSDRNLRILEAEYQETGGNLEPRMLFYFGRELADNNRPAEAIEVLEQCVKTSTWDDERYFAQIKVAELHNAMGNDDLAIDAYLAALKIFPTWPDAYFGLTGIYYFRNDWQKVKHWAEVGKALPLPNTMLFINHWTYTFNWLIYYTNALYHLGDIESALQWTRHALSLSPHDQWHQHNKTYFEQTLAERTPAPAAAAPEEHPQFTPAF